MWWLTPALACPSAPADPVAIVSVERDRTLDASFAIEADGWLGGDAAHSIPVAPDRSVWLFGDTFWGTSVDGTREGGWAFTNGSIALHDPTAPASRPVFFRGDDPTGFFEHRAPSGGDFYWTTQGVAYDGALYVFAMNVIGIGRQEGFSVLRVDEPLADPRDWTWTVTDVPLGDGAGLPITAVHVEEPWVYLFGWDDRLGPVRRTVLARASTDALVAGLTPDDVTWWTETGEWVAEPERAGTLIGEGVTESHVQWVPALGRWAFVVYNAFTGELRLSTAPSLTGPWTEPRCLWEVPEIGRIDSLIAYAGRLHPEYATRDDELVLTYVTNGFGTLDPLFGPGGGQAYRPHFLRVRLAPSEAPLLEGPTEAAPGERLVYTVTALPGEPIALAAGDPAGELRRPGCPETTPVGGARVVATAAADAEGRAELVVVVPPTAAGTVRLAAGVSGRCPVATLDLRVD